MDIEIIIKVFAYTIVMLWVLLFAVTLYQCNGKILSKRGYTGEFISYLRRTSIKRNVGIAIVVPVSGIISGLLINWLAGSLDQPQNLIYVYLLWIALIIPFPVLEMRKAPAELKELLKKTDTDVIIDFGYRILHLVFNPPLEIMFSILYLIYFMIFVELFHPAFIHIIILWLLYGAGRFAKNQTRPGMRETYLLNFGFMILNQFFLIFHVFREVLGRYSCEQCLYRSGFIMGLALGIALIIKAIHYLFQLPEYNMRLKT